MKTSKQYLSIFLAICLTFFTMLSLAATAVTSNEFGDEFIEENTELYPDFPVACINTTIYVGHSIDLDDNIPNSQYYWTSNGISSGTIYSYAQMNNLGQTIWRQDLISYNGMDLHHGNIYGPHIHYYTWTPYTNPQGIVYWNHTENIYPLYN